GRRAAGAAAVRVLHRAGGAAPDYEALLATVARRARRIVVFSHPPGHRVARLVVRGMNLFLALTRQEFRSFVHPPPALRAVLEREGFEVVARRPGRIWQALALTRAS